MRLGIHQFCVVFAILAMCTTSAHAQRSPENRGEDLVSRHCAMCHAIGRSGTSPDSKAPSFRTLGQRVPLDSLQEPLGRGLLSGHPEMPKFVSPQQDVVQSFAICDRFKNAERCVAATCFDLSHLQITSRRQPISPMRWQTCQRLRRAPRRPKRRSMLWLVHSPGTLLR